MCNDYKRLDDWPDVCGWYWYITDGQWPVPVEVKENCLWREGKKVYKSTVLKDSCRFYFIAYPEEMV